MKKFIFGLLCLVSFSVVNALPLNKAQTYAQKIDGELTKELTSLKINSNPIVSDDVFLRRAYLNIVGRIPTYDEYNEFSKINLPNKRQQLVAHLVKTPGYTSNMYNFWSDLLRVRERMNNVNFLNGSLYIKWLKDNIENNTPYDKFVKELLTAKGDYFNNPQIGYFLRDVGMMPDNVIATSKVFLATDIVCAQCHDHPFSDWTQKQFYQFMSLFNQAEPTGRKNPAAREKLKQIRAEVEELVKNDVKLRGLNNQVNNFLSATLASVNVEPNKQLRLPHDYRYKDELPNSLVTSKVLFGEQIISHKEDTREDVAEWIISPTNKTFAKNIVNRYWNLIFGYPLITPMDNIYDSNKLNSPLITMLADMLIEMNYDSKDFIQVLGSTQLFSRADYLGVPKDNYVFIGPVLRRLSAEQIWDSILAIVIDNPEYFKSQYADDYKNIMDIKDFDKLKLIDVREMITSLGEVQNKKYYGVKKFKQYNLIRASETNDNSADESILKTLGRSDRELISTSSKEGSVTQVISLVNGQLVELANMKDSSLNNNLKGKSEADKLEIVFKSILSRKPTIMEKSLFAKSSDEDLIWALVNTQEFRFE